MDVHMLAAFAVAFFFFAASPGPDNMTIVARTVSNGPLSGLAYGLGTVAGIFVYLALAAFGLSVLVSEMSVAMTILRYGGAAYLIWMGIRLWTQPAILPATAARETRSGFLQIFLTGIALNLGNPKMPLFYVALLPNFVTGGFGVEDFAMLAIIIVAIEIVVIGFHIWMANRARGLLRTPSVIRTTNRIAGLFLTGAGVATLAVNRAN